MATILQRPYTIPNKPELAYLKSYSKGDYFSLWSTLGLGLIEIISRYYYSGKQKNMIYFKLQLICSNLSKKHQSSATFFNYIESLLNKSSIKEFYYTAKKDLENSFD